MMRSYLQKPFRLDCLDVWLRASGCTVLDVGCGNHSALKTKQYYPACRYFGADRELCYNNDSSDRACMEEFFSIDLARCETLAAVPDAFFDCVIFSQVIEHITNGEEVLGLLADKLAPGGILYVESPSEKSARLPSMKGTLNFYDDPTHVRLYGLTGLERIIAGRGLSIIRSGTRRSWKRIILLPVYAGISLAAQGFISGHVLWDIAGFANFIVAKKP